MLPWQCLGGWGVPGGTRCPPKPLCHSPLDRGQTIQPWGLQSFSCHMFSLLPPTANAQVWGFPHLNSVIPVNPWQAQPWPLLGSSWSWLVFISWDTGISGSCSQNLLIPLVPHNKIWPCKPSAVTATFQTGPSSQRQDPHNPGNRNHRVASAAEETLQKFFVSGI